MESEVPSQIHKVVNLYSDDLFQVVEVTFHVVILKMLPDLNCLCCCLANVIWNDHSALCLTVHILQERLKHLGSEVSSGVGVAVAQRIIFAMLHTHMHTYQQANLAVIVANLLSMS